MLEEQSETFADSTVYSSTISTTQSPTAIATESNSPTTTTELDAVPEPALETEPEPETSASTESLATGLLTETLQGIQNLESEMQAMKRDFDAKVKYDESKERMIDVLHSELQSHREGLHFKILRLLFMDLISLYDDMNRIIENMSTDFPELDQAIVSNVQSFADSVEKLLVNNEVEPFQMEGETFVANKQRALSPIPTDDATLDKHIKRRVRKGFRYDNRILRPEVVEIYRYRATQ